jgi:hypothetical protein
MAEEGRRAIQLRELQRPREASTVAGGRTTFGNELLKLQLKALASL